MIPGHVLWGMPASLYTGKARAALGKRRVPFDERTPGHPEFRARIVPAVGRWIIPVLECPDGTRVQDSASIVEHLDRTVPDGPPSLPPDPAFDASASRMRRAALGLGVQPHAIPAMLQRFQDAVDACEGTPAGQGRRATLARAGLAPLVDARCRRRVERAGPLEVWGAPHEA